MNNAQTASLTVTATDVHVGRVCLYNGEYQVIVANNCHSVKIAHPETGVKLWVKGENVKILKSRLVMVTHRGAQYLVSKKRTIISMKSQRVMRWAPNHGVRLAILSLVEDL